MRQNFSRIFATNQLLGLQLGGTLIGALDLFLMGYLKVFNATLSIVWPVIGIFLLSQVLQLVPPWMGWVTSRSVAYFGFLYWPTVFAVPILAAAVFIPDAYPATVIGALGFTAFTAAISKGLNTFWFGMVLISSLLAVKLVTTEPFDMEAVSIFAFAVTMNISLAGLANLIYTSKKKIKREQEKSESLLLNILPEKVALELKEHGRTRPLRIDSATVLFTDFVGFTRIAESLTAEEVVEELDACFSRFDRITEEHGLEKIKTIGDSYMCAGGLPEPNHTHAVDCCLAALEIKAFIDRMQEIKQQQGKEYWELRLGIHTGPLVAGVIGHKKFAYDVWGDTVNTASRMESSGAAGKINISRSTYEAVKHFFDCEHRGKVKAKNKGEVDMYFLNGIKRELSVDGEGKLPNEAMKALYSSLRMGEEVSHKQVA
jgi:class 3 adenylate cyclase